MTTVGYGGGRVNDSSSTKYYRMLGKARFQGFSKMPSYKKSNYIWNTYLQYPFFYVSATLRAISKANQKTIQDYSKDFIKRLEPFQVSQHLQSFVWVRNLRNLCSSFATLDMPYAIGRPKFWGFLDTLFFVFYLMRDS